MPKKEKQKDPVEELAELFADIPANYDAIVDIISAQHDELVLVRDGAQACLEWLTTLRRALQLNKLNSVTSNQ